jgi:L-alanine-DL-glutamate epimerase-like enolase superfamily enzyme
MNTQIHMNRRTYLNTCSATAAAVWLVPRSEAAEEVRLISWELAEVTSLSKKLNPMLKLTATNGAVGFSKPVAKDLAAAAEAVKGANLLAHDELYDMMTAKKVPKSQIAAMDIACWDLHSRMLQKPLHALLGTKRTKIMRYGDVRGHQPALGLGAARASRDGIRRENYAAGRVRLGRRGSQKLHDRPVSPGP